jgi:predicted DNA binding CopG/RHH family protein
MKNSRSYEEAPAEISEAIMQSEIIEDFLPPPEQLILKEETVKVTLNLNKESVAFLKEEAKARGVPYQQMIRRIIDLYSQHYRKQMA